jgi:hypothetical protein
MHGVVFKIGYSWHGRSISQTRVWILKCTAKYAKESSCTELTFLFVFVLIFKDSCTLMRLWNDVNKWNCQYHLSLKFMVEIELSYIFAFFEISSQIIFNEALNQITCSRKISLKEKPLKNHIQRYKLDFAIIANR